MTVAEMIAALQKMPPDARVVAQEAHCCGQGGTH